MLSKFVLDHVLPRLLRLVYAALTRAFGKVAGYRQGLRSARWLCVHVTIPLQNRFRASKNKLDDNGVPYLDALGMVCLHDGRARRLTSKVRQALAEGRNEDAIAEVLSLEALLGLDIEADHVFESSRGA